MERRSKSLITRINDIESRLRTMRTVTNTASAEISGGETVINEDGSLFFMDGGRLILGGAEITTADGTPIVDDQGNLVTNSTVIYGDILSASDYIYQREAVSATVIDTNVVASTTSEIELGFPDWASSALVTYTIVLKTRIEATDSNKVIVSINGKPVARPRSSVLGDVNIHTTVVRRVYPSSPMLSVSLDIDDIIYPASDPRFKVTLGGVYSA